MRLYSYCLPTDDGAAPNPFWGVCTLVICKPGIRRTAEKGDWIAGTGAKYGRTSTGCRDLSGRLVYAMKVTDKLTMKEYDYHVRSKLPQKMPVPKSRDVRLRLGDAIYNFDEEPPGLRDGVHIEANRKTDLSGKYALLSTQFYYFGANAIELPEHLRPIGQNQQGHRVHVNAAFVQPFVQWIESLDHASGSLFGSPLLELFENEACGVWCAVTRAEAGEVDDAL
jgi:Nucleotide modification associated domain 2